MRSLFSTAWLTLVATLVLAPGVRAQVLLFDAFSDGNDFGWEHVDTSGVGIYEVTDDFAYRIRSGSPISVAHPFGGAIDTEWELAMGDPHFKNGVISATIRANTPETTLSLVMREDHTTFKGYHFCASASYGTFSIRSFDPSRAQPFMILATADPALFPFHAGEDWNLKGSVNGNRLTLKAWRVGDPEPKQPLLTVIDGEAGIGPNNGTEPCMVVFFDLAPLMARPVPPTEVWISGIFDDITVSKQK